MVQPAAPLALLAMRTSFLLFWLACVLGTSLPLPLAAQRLLWEQAFVRYGPYNFEGAAALIPGTGPQFLLAGGYAPPTSGSNCLPQFRAYYRLYDLSGALVREQLGRGLTFGTTDYAPSSPGAGWLTAAATVCAGTSRYARPFVQRLTLAGDTGRAWFLAPAPPQAYTQAILVQGNKIVTGGFVDGSGQGGQLQQVQLTCSDTLGRVRWQHNYPRLPFANDYATALLPTPRGGYLLSGDAYNITGLNYSHYIVETDSAGLLRRSRLIQPLGPGYPNGSRQNTQCNAIALPNAGGYLFSGTADSVQTGSVLHHRVGYLMRLDTALRVQWVYHHPPALAGTGSAQNYAYRIRLLPNGTVGLLLTDVRSAGTPDVFLVQVDVQTGQRVGFYTMSSNTQSGVLPWDWRWVGDGTLLFCGQSEQLGISYKHSYVARWDFRGTPLAARTAAEARATATFYAFPNPASGPVAFHWQLPPGQRAGAVRLYSPLGQLVRMVALPPTASGQQEVSGLAAGLYVARLVDADGRGQGSAQRLEVRE